MEFNTHPAHRDRAPAMRIGGKYNWKHQPERLVYIGRNWSGNGYWHQFEKVDVPGAVWCEVLDNDLRNFEETKRATPSQEVKASESQGKST